MKEVLNALTAERDVLAELLSVAQAERFDIETPSIGWKVRDQISHLAFFDDRAALAVTNPEAFLSDVASIGDVGMDAYMARHIDKGRSMSPSELMGWLASAGSSIVEALVDVEPDERIPWYGPPMRARSFAIARLMETWAHGQDIADALGAVRPVTDRLFLVAELGVRTLRFSYENRGLEVPDSRVRVALRGPSGTVKVWNDDQDASVTGPLEEFCLVVTQRRHVEDTHLVLEGDLAVEWMSIAQAFAGPPGPGRRPLTSAAD